MKYRLLLKCLIFFALLIIIGCGKNDKENSTNERVLYTTPGGTINTLDPALCADLVSSNMVGALYDTLLQYNYAKRPYILEPSMLKEMPTSDESMINYTFTLRDDLFFQPNRCFGIDKDGNFKSRKITSKDVAFSFLRIADSRLHSSGYWLLRNKVKNIGDFRERSKLQIDKFTPRKAKKDNSAQIAKYFSIYDSGCEGIEIVDDTKFIIHLDKSNPRFLYFLAMPYLSIVPREAIEYYGDDFVENPVGSGPFKLKSWERNYKIEFVRNPQYRTEYYKNSKNISDRTKKLPLLDRVVAYQVAQPLSSWLMFLKGDIDLSALDKDSFDAVVTDNLKLIPPLKKRGIEMIRIPKFQIHYIGFSFTDPILADNLNLRKAISLAYNVGKRVKIFNHRVLAAQGPIPHGVAGNDPNFINPYSKFNLELAKQYLKEAGYPNGIDPKSGKKLELTFDVGGTSGTHRQIAELFAEDMSKLGIKIIPILNNWPRFLQKSAKGEMQLFKVSWIGDYPDAENFLQLFYGPNSGSCNRTYYKDTKFDKMFNQIKTMKESPTRTKKYENMSNYLTKQCPWIFAYYPISYRLRHAWVENFIQHDFAFSRWKYLSINIPERIKDKKIFTPLKLEELRD